MRSTAVVAVLAASLTLTACGKKNRAGGPAPESQTSEVDAGRSAADREAEERARREAEEARRRGELARRDGMLSQMIFFDFDSFEIGSASQATLDEKLPLLRSNPGVTLRIEGHADEQGSSEYNLALGMRRANAAREYLTSYGVDASRLTVTSYGEERPLEPGQSENARARNRRAEFRVTDRGM